MCARHWVKHVCPHHLIQLSEPCDITHYLIDEKLRFVEVKEPSCKASDGTPKRNQSV